MPKAGYCQKTCKSHIPDLFVPRPPPMGTEASRIVRKLWCCCTVLRDEARPCGDPVAQASKSARTTAEISFSASCSEMSIIAHMPEPVRYCYFSYETLFSAYGPQPALCPFGAPLRG